MVVSKGIVERVGVAESRPTDVEAGLNHIDPGHDQGSLSKSAASSFDDNGALELKNLRSDLKHKDELLSSLMKEMDILRKQNHELKQKSRNEDSSNISSTGGPSTKARKSTRQKKSPNPAA